MSRASLSLVLIASFSRARIRTSTWAVPPPHSVRYPWMVEPRHCVYSSVLPESYVKRPRGGSYVAPAAGSTGDLINTILHEALGSGLGGARIPNAAPDLRLAGSNDVQDGGGASEDADVDTLPLEGSAYAVLGPLSEER